MIRKIRCRIASQINLVNLQVNRANAQSRPCGILFAQANGQVVFCAANFQFTAKTTCPAQVAAGEETRSEVGVS
jgi:hypothetical protein